VRKVYLEERQHLQHLLWSVNLTISFRTLLPTDILIHWQNLYMPRRQRCTSCYEPVNKSRNLHVYVYVKIFLMFINSPILVCNYIHCIFHLTIMVPLFYDVLPM
jgi:hypothetical protein